MLLGVLLAHKFNQKPTYLEKVESDEFISLPIPGEMVL
jgi:hypothetical protein